MHTLAFLSGFDLAAVVVVAVVIVSVLATGRVLHLNVKGLQATVEERGAAAARTAEEAAATAEEARTAALSVAEAVGIKNGNGDLMGMMARVLSNQAEAAKWHDDQIDTERRLVELATYAHTGIHDLRNTMTPIKAQVDVLFSVLDINREKNKT